MSKLLTFTTLLFLFVFVQSEDSQPKQANTLDLPPTEVKQPKLLDLSSSEANNHILPAPPQVSKLAALSPDNDHKSHGDSQDVARDEPETKEQPKPEQPKLQKPKPEERKPEEPKPEQPKLKPQPKGPKPEQPKPEQPKPEQLKPEQLKQEEPKLEEPKPEEFRLDVSLEDSNEADLIPPALKDDMEQKLTELTDAILNLQEGEYLDDSFRNILNIDLAFELDEALEKPNDDESDAGDSGDEDSEDDEMDLGGLSPEEYDHFYQMGYRAGKKMAAIHAQRLFRLETPSE